MMLSTLISSAAIVIAMHGNIARGLAVTGVGSARHHRPRLPPRHSTRRADVDDRHRRHRRHHHDDTDNDIVVGRIDFLASIGTTVARTAFALFSPIMLVSPLPSNALVRGNPPPPKRRPPTSMDDDGGGGITTATTTSSSSISSSTTPPFRCRNVEECRELAEREEDLRMRSYHAGGGDTSVLPRPKYAPGGTRYLDVVDDDDENDERGGGERGVTSTSTSSSTIVAEMGDVVDVRYRVLKIGKRSYDGLSGEGTVIFSRGYGLEDDEDRPGDRSFRFTIGDERIIGAMNDAVPGMTVGSTRRISVMPRNGWEKNTRSCDGGPGGLGAGGELRTDYVVVPTATMVEQEACFDRTKLPFPNTYAQERRMAQRFDQSLILEVRLVGLSRS
ncbi:hypothetical protein ACHAXA_005991 [Cyclostephanos tholiformis]|uniref:peptidylprolyl isomerase n=1 Tax=Cyclostephanos tholiformis TaxID=382380 RepID=A0ABD3SQN0_9STRA